MTNLLKIICNLSVPSLERNTVATDNKYLIKEHKEGDFIPTSIWVKNNEPLITFYSGKEYDDYMKEALAFPIEPQSMSHQRIVLTLSGLLFIFVSLITRFYFRRLKNLLVRCGKDDK